MHVAELYIEAQRSFTAMCEGLTGEQWTTVVPCNPEWRVWDVLSHVAGVTDDIVNGRVEGAATDPWTAVQVERWRETPRADLIEQWGRQIEHAAAAVAAIGEIRPPLDCHTHEHDVRHALGLGGNRDSELVRWMVTRVGDVAVGEAIDVEFEDGQVIHLAGPGEPVRLRGVSQFELVRSRLGRRSRAQVAGWDWSRAPSDDLLAEWFVFGPSPVDIDE